MSEAGLSWQPTATLHTLQRRAAMLARTRAFFAERGVLEVETPSLVAHAVTDVHLASIPCSLAARPGTPVFLHTSPEYHMKRLLAAGSPDIYQICKAYRDGELGSRHLPEFTIIEWYRKGMDLAAMVTETCDLIRSLMRDGGRTMGAERTFHYPELMRLHTGVDPLQDDRAEIVRSVQQFLGDCRTAELRQSLGADPGAWLDLMMVEAIEPRLRGLGMVVIDRYPAGQAALARLAPEDSRVAERFEVYLDGLEIANGYRELTDWSEQERRFTEDRKSRAARRLEDGIPDKRLLDALKAGLPDCSGVALGFDRVVMAALGLGSLREAVSFPSADLP